MGTAATAISLAGTIIVIALVTIWWLVRTNRDEAVLDHVAKEAKQDAEATRKAAGELVRHVDRGDVAKSLRDGVF